MEKIRPVLRENVQLSELTTLGVGGAARYLCSVTSELELEYALEAARDHRLPVLILGGGSNLLVSDSGFAGVVVQIELHGIAFEADGNDIIVSVKAGENWDSFVSLSVEKNLAGIENLSGIPGYVGATPIQNVGAYGQEVGTTIEMVRVWDRIMNRVTTLNKANCGFEYRTSIFNTASRDRYVVLEVVYRLAPDGTPNLKYRDLAEYFAGRNSPPSLEEVRSAVLSIRRAKGMVIDPRDPDSRSAGSFFKNPIVSADQLETIPDAPSFSAGNRFKIPAAWLVERAGFSKGHVKGRAGISSKHSLAIINRGGATAAEIIDLANEMRERVKTIFKIDLEPEPVSVGFS